MENIFAKGGKTKVKYDYIPKKAIDELSYTIDKVTKGISGDKLLSGVYVKSDAKSKTKSGSNLTAKILAMTDDEDKKEVILEKDVKEFQKYISDKLITAFYLGLPLAYDFKGDYSYGGGVITMVVDDAKRKTTQAIKNAKNKKFELGLKYPQYDFEKLLGKPIIKDVFGKTMTFNDGTTEKYKYRLWIWKDCVIGQTLGSENSSRGFNDYTYGKEPTLIGGYKSVQTSKESKLESIINFMAKDKDGFVKDNNVLYNGLGGANFETLETNKIKYAKGGEMDSEDIVAVYQFGKEKDADDFFLMADKFTDYDVLRLSPFAIQYVGGKEGFEFLYERAETYESNSLDLYAKGGKTKRSKHSLMQDRKRVSSEPWEVAYQKRKSKMAEGGEVDDIFEFTLTPKTSTKSKGKAQENSKSLVKGVDNNSKLENVIHYATAEDTKRADPSSIQSIRVRVFASKKDEDKIDTLADLYGFKVSSSRKATMKGNKFVYAEGGTLPTLFGQAGLVGETGAMNEMDLFAMGGGLPQGVHQYYANTYNPAYPTPHGYAKGGMTDVERQSMIDMGYSEEQIKEVEDNPRRGGRFAKGGAMASGGEVLVVKTKKGLKTMKDFQDFSKDEIKEWGTERGLKYNAKGEKFGGQALKVDEFFVKPRSRYNAKLPSSNHAKGGALNSLKKQMNDDLDIHSEYYAKGGRIVGEYYFDTRFDKPFRVIYVDGNKMGIEYIDKKNKKTDTKTINKSEFDYNVKMGAWNKYTQPFTFAKGGEIQMSEVYNVNGKDYLFHTPLQNDKGTYTGWDAYEVVYDIKDGEKHLNYTKTKKGKSKYFPNEVKRTEAEDSFAKGGKIRKSPFKVGDMVYSYQNPNDKMRVSFVEDRGVEDGVDYGWGYKVALKTDEDGKYDPKGKYSQSSKWMSQNSVSKTKKTKYAKGGNVTIPPHANHKEQDEFLKRMNTDENEFGIQGYNDKLDESLGNTKGKRSTKEQNYKDRRNESEAMKKKGGKRKYSSVKTMDKGSRSKRKTPLTLAKEIRKEGEKWQDAVKRASAILKKEAK